MTRSSAISSGTSATIRPDVIAGFLCGGERRRPAPPGIDAPDDRGVPRGRGPGTLSRTDPRRAASVAGQAGVLHGGFVAPGQAAPAPSRDLLRVESSEFDPLLGRTYSELGLEGRSMHKCQGTSQLLLLPGASPSRTYRLKDTRHRRAGRGAEGHVRGDRHVGSGPCRLCRRAAAGGARVGAPDHRGERRDGVPGTRRRRAPRPHAGRSRPGLPPSVSCARTSSPWICPTRARYEIDFRLAPKERQFQDALVLTHGIRVEVLADDGVVVPGQPIKLSLVAGNNGPADVAVKSVQFAGFVGDAPACAGAVQSGSALTCATRAARRATHRCRRRTGRRARTRRDTTSSPACRSALPFRPTPFRATVALSIGGADVSVERTVEYRYSDLFAGEKRMELQVVPPFDVRVSPEIAVVPTPAAPRRTASAAARASGRPHAHRRGDGQQQSERARLRRRRRCTCPTAGGATPPSAPVKFERENEDATVKFSVTPPAVGQAGRLRRRCGGRRRARRSSSSQGTKSSSIRTSTAATSSSRRRRA